MNTRDRYLGALLGLAAGDAVGTTVEFMPRGSFEPVEDMVGGGPFDLAPGQWTDDTSMALCLAESLISCRDFDARDQMERYCRWVQHGHLSSTGDCFDVGNTVAAALARYLDTGNPIAGSTEPESAGNGSLMRLAPVVLQYFPDRGSAVHHAGESSRTTHGAQEAVHACEIFAEILCNALEGRTKAEVPVATVPAGASRRLASICEGAYRTRPASAIRGSGYVVDCLEAALWCFSRTIDFADAILLAANLGDDADTTAAVVGQVAGAYYGVSGIPEKWAERLTLREQITHFAETLWKNSA